MLKIENIKENLKGIVYDEDKEEDFFQAVRLEFEGYSYEGITEVCITPPVYNKSVDFIAYVNHEDAPIIGIIIEGSQIRHTDICY